MSLPNVLKSSDKGISIPFELTFLTGTLELSVNISCSEMQDIILLIVKNIVKKNSVHLLLFEGIFD